MTAEKIQSTADFAFRILRSAILLGLLLAVFTGCENEPMEVEDYEPEPVLHAYLNVNEPFGKIYLEWVYKDIETYYDPAENGIVGAQARIFTVSSVIEDPARNRTKHLISPGDPDYYEVEYRSSGSDGVYHPVDYDSTLVRPGMVYRLEASLDGRFEISAETETPDTFTLKCVNYPHLENSLGWTPPDISNMPDSLTFNRRMDPIVINWSNAWSDVRYYGNRRGGYLISYQVVQPIEEIDLLNADTTGADWDAEEYREFKEEINRAGVMYMPDYIDRIELFWLIFTWTGTHKMELMAGSVSYYNYLYFMQQANASPGEVTRPQSNVENGLGCFGAVARHTFYISMEN